MAAEIAAHLDWPMHVLSVKKLPHPENPEFAIGAVGRTEVFLDELHADVPKEYLDREIARIRQVLQHRDEAYHQQPLDVADKTVIIVDDGIATGLTMRCAIKILRAGKPRSIIIAVPVAAADAVRELHPLVDEFVVLHVPATFGAVGEWYTNFNEVSDEEVLRTVSVSSSHGSNGQPLERALFGR